MIETVKNQFHKEQNPDERKKIGNSFLHEGTVNDFEKKVSTKLADFFHSHNVICGPSYKKWDKNNKGWNYPEFIDSMVIIGNNILLFSDKSRQIKNYEKKNNKEIIDIMRNFFQDKVSSNVKKDSSISQLSNAKKHILNNGKIYFNKLQKQKEEEILIKINQETKIHLITTISGVGDLISDFKNKNEILHYKENYSFGIDTYCFLPRTKTEKNFNKDNNGFKYHPRKDILCLYDDYTSDGDFHHIFDSNIIEAIFLLCKTPRDFIEYLNKRADFFSKHRINGQSLFSYDSELGIYPHIMGKNPNYEDLILYQEDTKHLFTFIDDIYNQNTLEKDLHIAFKNKEHLDKLLTLNHSEIKKLSEIIKTKIKIIHEDPSKIEIFHFFITEDEYQHNTFKVIYLYFFDEYTSIKKITSIPELNNYVSLYFIYCKKYRKIYLQSKTPDTPTQEVIMNFLIKTIKEKP